MSLCLARRMKRCHSVGSDCPAQPAKTTAPLRLSCITNLIMGKRQSHVKSWSNAALGLKHDLNRALLAASATDKHSGLDFATPAPSAMSNAWAMLMASPLKPLTTSKNILWASGGMSAKGVLQTSLARRQMTCWASSSSLSMADSWGWQPCRQSAQNCSLGTHNARQP